METEADYDIDIGNITEELHELRRQLEQERQDHREHIAFLQKIAAQQIQQAHLRSGLPSAWELLSDEKRNPWKRAIIDAAVVNWTLTKEHETDPRSAVNALLTMCAQMALDPLISSEAAELVAKTKKAALLEAAEVIAMEGLDGYADQLRLMAEGE